jgi:hypothetical protein
MQMIKLEYPSCDICVSGGIPATDCPDCRHRVIPYFQAKLEQLQAEVKQLRESDIFGNDALLD